MNNAISEKKYWESIYSNRASYKSPIRKGYTGFVAKQVEKKIEQYSPYDSIIEIGGGGSDWLIYLYKKFKPKKIAALDYTEAGCRALDNKAREEGISIEILQEDILALSEYGNTNYDLVFSYGLVEHFSNLQDVLNGKKEFLSENGVMITIIPNMTGLNGILTKFLDKSIYDIHVPYSLDDLKLGHTEAGIKILDSGYLCSNHFGVLSSCKLESVTKMILYKTLALIGRVQLAFEYFIHPLPTSRFFSPYIYVVGKRNKV